MARNSRDSARFQEMLCSTVVRLAAALAATGPEGRRAVQKIRRQDIEGAFHEISDDVIRAELDNLSTTLNRAALAPDIDLRATERSFNGRANQGTRGRPSDRALLKPRPK